MEKPDFQPSLSGPKLSLRPMRETDRDALYEAASDPQIWALHPASNRHERAVFDPYFTRLLAQGGALVALRNGRIIGTSSFYVAHDPPGALSIGYTFLERAAWGGQTNFELKALMIAHLLKATETVWFHIDLENLRSQRATLKLGAVFDGIREMDFGTGTGPQPRKCYQLSRTAWETTCQAQGLPPGQLAPT